MFNNEATYHEKWQTDANKIALKKMEKYLSRSECSSDCPLSWAPEVLELLTELDKELGIARTDSTSNGFLITGNPVTWFVTDPVRAFFYTVHLTLKDGLYFKNKSSLNKVIYCFNVYARNFLSGFYKVKVRCVNPILNKVLRPKIRLTQVKEKFGSIRLYYYAPPQYVEYIDSKIRDLEIKLAMKGAYYSIEKLWNSSTTSFVDPELDPDIIQIREDKDYRGKRSVRVKKSLYRKKIKDAGIDVSSFVEGLKDD